MSTGPYSDPTKPSVGSSLSLLQLHLCMVMFATTASSSRVSIHSGFSYAIVRIRNLNLFEMVNVPRAMLPECGPV